MCWNYQVSFLTWVFGGIMFLYLRKRNFPNDFYIGCFIFTFSSMQFLEFLIWLDVDCAWGVNDFATKFAVVNLWFQPFILCFLAPRAHGYYFFSKSFVFFFGLFLFGIPMLSVFFYLFLFNSNCFCSKKGVCGQLSWSWVSKGFSLNDPMIHPLLDPMYNPLVDYAAGQEIKFLIPLLLLKPLKYSFPMFFVASLFSFGKYVLSSCEWGEGEISSMWCWELVFIGLLAILNNKSKYYVELDYEIVEMEYFEEDKSD